MHGSEISFEVVPPIREAAEAIRGWRNDSRTLSMSYHTEPKKQEPFWEEFRDTYFRYPNLPPLFALADGHRVGFLRFLPLDMPAERLRDHCDISINVAPAYRSKGLGTAILMAIKSFLREQGIDDLHAEVRVENEASRRVFERAGFENTGERDKRISDTGEVCHIVQYRARLTPVLFSADRVMVIAEAGSNWRMGTPARDLAMGKTLIDVAVEAGADVVKFQTYRPETVYTENAGKSDYLTESGIQEDIRAIFRDLAMPYEMVADLAEHCRRRSILFMSTPFSPSDFHAVDPHTSLHKIASYEISHLRLLELAARSGKPLILSTGASVEADIGWAVETYRSVGGRDLCLMQCTAKYPAPPESMNLKAIPWLKRRFGVAVGLSDHSRHPTYAPLCAVALGARVIEKHYTLDNRLPGPDHSFAITPAELREMVAAIRAAEPMLGSGIKDVLDGERELHKFARRGVQAIRAIAPGEPLREGFNIDILRPGKQRPGVHPRYLASLEGRRATRAILAGDGIQPRDWSDG
jgi:sialic acid synthase SpsE/RimJ/RimL family protein N-acetyltransferase